MGWGLPAFGDRRIVFHSRMGSSMKNFALFVLLVPGIALAVHRGFGPLFPDKPVEADCKEYFDLEADIRNGTLRCVIFGLIDSDALERQEEIARRYGFSYRPIGCVIEWEVPVCAEIYNQGLFDYLTTVHGSGWELRYQASLDSLERVMEQEPPKPLFLLDSL